MGKINARTNRGQRETERETFARGLTERKSFAIMICKENPCVFDERKPCSVLKSLFEARSLKNKCVLTCVYSQLQWERSERDSIPRSTFSQQCIRAIGCPRGGGCTSSPSNITWPSGQLKLGTDIKFQRAWACRGVLFDGEVIKMESHPANCNSGS